MSFVNFAPKNMTSDVLPTPYVASASGEVGGPAYKCFDGIYTWPWWYPNAEGTPGWIQIYVSNLYYLNNYSITMFGSFYPIDWTMKGSLDGITWDILDTRSGVTTGWTGYTPRNFTCATCVKKYNYFRFDYTNSNGGIVCTEIDLFHDPAFSPGGFLNRNYFWDSY